MAKNFPDIWIGRVEKNLKNTDLAPWLDGVPEIGAETIMIGEGTDAEKCKIFLPTTDFEPQVFINNTTYPLALQEYDDDTIEIALDKYQTAQTSISDDAALGSSYDVIDTATKSHTSAINTNKYAKAIHAIAPNTDSANTPVVTTTGENDGTGRRQLIRKDLVALKKKFDVLQVPMTERRLVLCPDHIADLLNIDQHFANQYYNYSDGKIAKSFGFEIYENVSNPYFSSYVPAAGQTPAVPATKKSVGSVVGDGDFQASVAFYVPNIGKKTGLTKQYFSDAKTDTANQTNKLNYRHYFIAVPKRAQYIGALISGKVA
ncbi:MAG: hypothetical protein LBN95_06020 [Prevotellaceae bacterium]|jgi:hypothetical protein|nr:hypothetical protein [Prevotellaceae bacterium]